MNPRIITYYKLGDPQCFPQGEMAKRRLPPKHLAEQLGLALTEMAENHRYPVVVRTEIDYRRPAKLGDQLVIEGWLDRVERVRFWCGFQITRPADNMLIARCRQMLALIEMPEGKLLRLPEHWEKYRSDDSAELEREDRTPISGKEAI